MRYSGYHFAVFRVLFGVYLAGYLLTVLPYAAELFGAHSFWVTAPRGGFAFRQVFPSILDSDAVAMHASAFIGVLVGLSLSFALGIGRRFAAVLLWYGLTCLVNRSPGILNPSHAFIGWLCLASAIVPAGEPWRVGRRRPSWAMPPALFWGAWWVLALGYSASGFAKLKSAGWLDGTAMALTLDMAYARHGWARAALLAAPGVVLRLCTWSVLGIEIGFALLALFPRTRRFAWYAAVLMHCALLVLFDFWELSVGMLLFHVFTFDDRWGLRPAFFRRDVPGDASPRGD